MLRHATWALAAGLLLTAARPGRAEPPAKGPDDAAKLAAAIDRLIEARLKEEGVQPAPLADDGAFLRRLSLDVVGRVPAVSEARRFLKAGTPDKRRRELERLLDSPGYINHFTNVWRDLLMPEANADFQRRYLVPGVESWLRRHFTENTPYDKMVRELITLKVTSGRDAMQEIQDLYNGRGDSPIGFYMAKEGKPENLAASTARLFLGVRLECAQCHDHPFGGWTRDEFWGQAAFFAGIKGPRGDFYFGQLREVGDRRELPIPGTERVAQARFLDGKEPRWKYKVSAREALADWMTAKDNPYFARTAVNRMWGHFFGVGLVDPVDDFTEENKPSHPELLDELARQFVAHNYDFKFLARAITMSKAYQRSSAYPSADRPDARLFACMPVKGLSPEQLYDSILEATRTRDNTPLAQRAIIFGGPRQEFMQKFAAQERRTDYQTSIPQALAMMNSNLVNTATHPAKSELLAAVNEAPFLSTAGRVEALFLATLCRKPTP
ncbi:MAG TPA: DUF1549 and DUF1553 domain-containing protein [Gemmataceae bacterium]|nr:DUF1549 and DUF1553 domain-containing protein [Gemmataceae bacterium]